MVAKRTSDNGGHKSQKIDIGLIVLDREYYPRVQSNWQTVARYADALRAGEVFPPVEAVKRGREYVVIDGWHRVLAYKQVGTAMVMVIVHVGLPRKRWLLKAAELNRRNGRQMSKQDRVMVAVRLQQQGHHIKTIAALFALPVDRLNAWLSSSVVHDSEGDHAIKSAMSPLVGTEREGEAVQHGGPVACPDVRSALDQLLAMLRAGLVDPAVSGIGPKVEELHRRLGELLPPMAIAK